MRQLISPDQLTQELADRFREHLEDIAIKAMPLPQPLRYHASILCRVANGAGTPEDKALTPVSAEIIRTALFSSVAGLTPIEPPASYWRTLIGRAELIALARVEPERWLTMTQAAALCDFQMRSLMSAIDAGYIPVVYDPTEPNPQRAARISAGDALRYLLNVRGQRPTRRAKKTLQSSDE